MKNKKVGLFLMVVAIGIMGFQIGATAKYQDSRYAFLLPLGIGLLLVGLFLVLRQAAKEKEKQD